MADLSECERTAKKLALFMLDKNAHVNQAIRGSFGDD
jgi:hypothetical protein